MYHAKILLPLTTLTAFGVAGPASGQDGGFFSASYNFLKAVKERDLAKVTQLMGGSPTIVNTKDQSTGEAALHIVTRARDTGWMRYLLESGADPNTRDRDGVTPLLIAVDQRFTDGARLLLAGRADINLQNRSGETPLIKAVQLRDQAMVRLLVERGANPDIADNLAGYSARDYADRDSRGSAIAQILKEAGKPSAPAPSAAAVKPPGS